MPLPIEALPPTYYNPTGTQSPSSVSAPPPKKSPKESFVWNHGLSKVGKRSAADSTTSMIFGDEWISQLLAGMFSWTAPEARLAIRSNTTAVRHFVKADPTRDAESAIKDASDDVEELLAAMIRGDVLPRSSEYLEECGRVAQAIEADSHQPEDIEAWSRRLADDLSKFSD